MSNAIDAAIRGALGGVAGGLAMYGMKQKVAPKVIPEDMHRQEFAPKTAVEWAEEKVGHPYALTQEQEMNAAMAAHLAYSASFGALYGLVRRRADGVPTPLAGAIFGLVVWGINFEGLMPALGMMPATTDLPIKKWPPDLMGHVVYGAATAVGYELLESVLD
jgi:uncharacterized membrane protein YagU involved in acid resistance